MPTVSAATAATMATKAITQIMAMPRRHHQGRGGLWNIVSKTLIVVERPPDEVQMNAAMLTGAMTAALSSRSGRWRPSTSSVTGGGDARRRGPMMSSPFSWRQVQHPSPATPPAAPG